MARRPIATERPRGTVRCAVYTRKSSEEGLEQAFNSLDALRMFPKAIWGVTGTGHFMFRAATLGLAMGCDLVRVGFEDGIHLPDGSVARDNSEMVRAAVDIAAIYGMKPASVEEARTRFRI